MTASTSSTYYILQVRYIYSEIRDTREEISTKLGIHSVTFFLAVRLLLAINCISYNSVLPFCAGKCADFGGIDS